MTTAPPTDRQLAVLRLVHAGENLRAIGTALGISSTNGPADHIRALVRKGLVVEVRPHAKFGRWKVTEAGLAVMGLKTCEACCGAGTVVVPVDVAALVAPPVDRVGVLRELVAKRSAGGRR